MERSGSPDEQALEWHEVIELQEFSERKAWIEEKTKVSDALVTTYLVPYVLNLDTSFSNNCHPSKYLLD